jgi:hypothetical protein
MVLSDRTIREELARGRLIIEPLNDVDIQPASVDVHLDRKLIVFRTLHEPFFIDVRRSTEGMSEVVELEDDKPFYLQPAETAPEVAGPAGETEAAEAGPAEAPLQEEVAAESETQPAAETTPETESDHEINQD